MRKISFYVDYQKFNIIIKNNQYSIFYIEKNLSQLKNAKYFIKIDISQIFIHSKCQKI